jgi:hypothetical protein
MKPAPAEARTPTPSPAQPPEMKGFNRTGLILGAVVVAVFCLGVIVMGPVVMDASNPPAEAVEPTVEAPTAVVPTVEAPTAEPTLEEPKAESPTEAPPEKEQPTSAETSEGTPPSLPGDGSGVPGVCNSLWESQVGSCWE